jgi:hypothetical protein
MNGKLPFDPIGYPSRDVAPAALRASTVQLSQFLESARTQDARLEDTRTRGAEEFCYT